MEPFLVVSGKAAPMLASNIDTDVIMPKQFLKGIDRQGLDRGLFFDERFLESGEPNPEFILNQSSWVGAKFLVVGPNFGCGSSREHAVWGLKQLGIRALIGTSFAGIFYDNCMRNGVLLIELLDEQIEQVAAQISLSESNEITVDLASQVISLSDGHRLPFVIDQLRKESLLEGLDAIGATLQNVELIQKFERSHLLENPWLS
jgi:3-isopropylmalate/(R)-2-methylmalate dehydratase small subunit